MSPKPYRLLLALSVAVLAAVGPVLAAGSEPHWTLEQAGRSYTYSVTVASDLPAAVLLNVLFDPQHVAAFSRSAGRLSVLRQDGDVNEVRFDTRHFFYKCSSTFRRTRDRETATITIDMLSFTAGWGKLAPQALASRARYTVADKGTDREVVYRQDVETDRPVSGISLRLLRKSLREFARDLQEYLQRPELRRDAGMPAGAPVEPRGAR